MSYYEKQVPISLPVSADMTGNPYKFCTMTTTGIALNTSAGGPCIGVICPNDGDALGKVAGVAIEDVMKVHASDVIAVGAQVASTALGLGVTAAAADYSQGVALEASTATGELIAVRLHGPAQINA